MNRHSHILGIQETCLNWVTFERNLLEEFDFIIQHRPRTQHAIADFLSRLDNSEMVAKDDDDFPDVDILRVATIAMQTDKSFPDRWLMEMTYFLTTKLPPPQLRTDEKK